MKEITYVYNTKKVILNNQLYLLVILTNLSTLICGSFRYHLERNAGFIVTSLVMLVWDSNEGRTSIGWLLGARMNFWARINFFIISHFIHYLMVFQNFSIRNYSML